MAMDNLWMTTSKEEAAIEKSCEGTANDVVVVENFGKEGRYPMRERRPLEE